MQPPGPPLLSIAVSNKGRIPLPKRMNFRKSSKGGGGVIFNPKIYVADFCHYRRNFGHEFQKKFATQLSENEGAKNGQK